MFKYSKLIVLGIVSLASLGVAAYVFFIPKNYDFKIFGGSKTAEEINPNDLYEITKIKTFDPEPNWFPKEEYGTSSQPEIAGEAAVLVELDTAKILYEKESAKKMKIASLTKIMTAVLALEHKEINSTVMVSEKAASVGENSMSLTAGEIYTIEELLYGLILNSGNDAAYALAESVAGDSGTFVLWMNKKAAELGMKNTYFADPSGLDDSTYSTPADLVKLTRYALKFDEFKKIASSLEINLSGEKHKSLSLYNQTNLLNTYPGVKGVKTGFTEEAGLCLVTYADNSGKEVVGVVLKSFDRKGDMVLMLDHGYSTLGVDVKHNLY